MRFPGIPDSSAARQAILVSGLMMAWQLAAKTTRDSLFLAVFPATALPGAVGAAAVCSILVALLSAKLVHRFGPYRLIPSVYLLGAGLHLLEWLLLSAFPRPAAAFIYVHIMALGPVMLSGFWALASERFDPREARRRFGQITAFGTLGSLAGGLMAERVATLTSSTDLLILLAVLQVAASFALFRFAPAHAAEKSHQSPSFPEMISGAPYLVGLAAFVLLVSMSAAGLDFLFRSRAVLQFGKGADLSRFFAIFYTSTSVATFAVQAGLSKFWLKRFGPGSTVATLPVAVTGASVISLLAPGAAAIIVSRGLEQLLRGSLYRSGYELFYTPMPAGERRSIKSVIDIGADRLGEGLAAAAIQLLLVFPAEASYQLILAATGLWSGAAAWLAFRLDRAYVTVLEKGLAKQTVTIAPEEIEDPVTRSIVLRSSASIAAGGQPGQHAFEDQSIAPGDLTLRRLAELRSKDPLRARAALHGIDLRDPLLVPQVIEMLGRDETARAAHDALSRGVDNIAGQLADRLADPLENEKIRRRLPRVLAASKTPLAWHGLFRQLRDERFEIRQRCARGLEKMLQEHPEFRPEPAAVFELVASELSISRKSLSKAAAASAQEDGEGADLVDEVLRERGSQVMTHVSTLLGLVLPQQSIRLAFRALYTEDAKLRGVALEYLDSVLPKGLREQFAAQIEGPVARPAKSGAAPEDALSNLMDESPSIMARLDNLRGKGN
jgi:AAA family ATP:ADP antiporter